MIKLSEIRERLKEPLFKAMAEEAERDAAAFDAKYSKHMCLSIYTVMGLAGWGVVFGIYWLISTYGV